MATLADSFLADLEDLSDDEKDVRASEWPGGAGGDHDMDGDDGEDDLEAGLETISYDNLDAVAKLQNSQRYQSILERVTQALSADEKADDHGAAAMQEGEDGAAGGNRVADSKGKSPAEPVETGRVAPENNPEYQLILDCNALLVDIDNEIAVIHAFIRDKYRLKFPELESLVMHPIDYARVVKAIGNETDITLVNLEGILPSATIMVVSVTATTTSGKPLPPEQLERTLAACDRALGIDEAKRTLLGYVEARMTLIAPNTSAVVGTAVAAKLVGLAGGVHALAKMPSCNVKVLGAKRKTLAGFSTASVAPHVGLLASCEVVQNTPPPLRSRAVSLVAGKVSLMARVDDAGADREGRTGREMLAAILAKIEKWQEPPPPKKAKPLPVPDMEVKKRRGGKRLRKRRERYGMTDMRKAANRMNFGEVEETFIGAGIGEGIGVLGSSSGGGKMRIVAKASKLAAKAAKKYGARLNPSGPSGTTSGLSSSLAFTPVQGIELENPSARAHNTAAGGTDSTYFNASGTFSKVRRV